MRIITWNCNMAFRKKSNFVLKLMPDILVIQECEHPSKFLGNYKINDYNQFLWYGDNQNKGIGIITFNNWEVQLLEVYNNAFKYIIPLRLTGPIDINLFAVWAMPAISKIDSYVGQIWKAMNYYKTLLEVPSIICGDLNSNQIWDHERQYGNHTDLVNLFSEYNIHSLYHSINKIAHGKETDPTLYLLKNVNKPYHMDYCFVSQSLANDLTNISIGKYNEWIRLSDHMPIIVDDLIK